MTNMNQGRTHDEDDRRELKQIMTEKPMTQQQHDALQRRRVEQRRRMEDIARDKQQGS